MSDHSSRPVAIDLFCGAGGLSEGLRQAGFDPRVGLDFDQHAISTYRHNHPESRAFLEDVNNVSGQQLIEAARTDEIDLVAGGPSCQGFSTHGKRIEDDPRNFLFTEFVRLVNEIQPKFFLMENVRGLLTYSKGRFKELIEQSFREIGYNLVAATVCAADYGVPQLRHRVLFIGTRANSVNLTLPAITHGDDDPSLLPYVTVEDAISDLPLMKGDCRREIWDYATEPNSDFQEYVRAAQPNHVTLHQANSLSPQASSIARHVRQGEGLRSVPLEALPDRFKKMRTISNGELRKDCTTLYHRLHPAKPSYTITCYYRNIASGPFLHPWENRSLSHREAARLMSFPDHYEFKGSAVPRQIGNAVPPLMGKTIGEHIIKMLLADREDGRRRAA
tara:strand:+ start:3230 stop:4399 length:1170 start_codon:yes stop_codon:yes gene_type:complete